MGEPSFFEVMEHEEYRWSYMSKERLRRRLKRITKELKLRAFMTIARRTFSWDLLSLAVDRARDLGYSDLGREFSVGLPRVSDNLAERLTEGLVDRPIEQRRKQYSRSKVVRAKIPPLPEPKPIRKIILEDD